MTFLLVFLIYGSPPDLSVGRHPTWEACQEAAMTLAEAALRQRRRVWFRCVEVASSATP